MSIFLTRKKQFITYILLILNILYFLARFWHISLQKRTKNMRKHYSLLNVSIFLTLSTSTLAQSLTLDDCMRYAVEHSTAVNEKRLAADDSRSDYIESFGSFFPSISASVGGATNFGRSIDPATNNYTNVTTFSNSYSLSASMTLFDGLQNINTIRAAKVARSLGAMESEIASDETAMETMSAYMDVVYYKEAVEIARLHLESSQNTLQLTRQQYGLGLKSAADVAEIESQTANYEYLLLTEENNLDLAYIKLRETMNYPQDEELNIVTDIQLEPSINTHSKEELIEYSLLYNPRIAAAKQATEIKRLQLKRAQGAFAPSLYLYGGYNTNYFIDFDNKSAYDPFSTQFRNNRGAYIQLSLSIPIFTGLGRYSSYRKAKNAWRSAQFAQTATERAVESEVCETWQQMHNTKKLYQQGDKKVNAAQLVYDGATKKFEKGLISALELQTASTTLLQAKAERLKARLQHIIKQRMVDYYSGKPIIRE